MLQQALISLIQEKGYEAITIEDICAAANVGRSTFYAHYTSKDDLKRSGLENHLREMLLAASRSQGDGGECCLGFGLAMFEHARDHLDLYRALVGGRGGAVVLGTIRQILSDLVRNELAAHVDENSGDIPREFVVQYVVGAYMAVLTWWLDGGARLPAGEVNGMFQRLAFDGVVAAVQARAVPSSA
jgi:AcrR family transcriptional regulator